MQAINDVTALRVLSRFVVELTFETGDVRVLELEPYLEGPAFEPLRQDCDLFRLVRADPEAGTIVWPNGADISPMMLYVHSRPAVPHGW